MEGWEKDGEEFSILVAPDHPTPIAIKTHCSDPVPYIIYRSNKILSSGVDAYDEESAKISGISLSSGEELMKRFLRK